LRANSPYPRRYFKKEYSREGYFKKLKFEEQILNLLHKYRIRLQQIIGSYYLFFFKDFYFIDLFFNRLAKSLIFIHAKFIKLWIIYNTNRILFTIFIDKRSNPNSIEFIIYHTKSLTYSTLFSPIKFSSFF
jgi:hypothetical protein